MSNLARIQWDFQEFLLRDSRNVETHVTGTERVPAATRLDIYANAYRSRLAEALQSNYPAMAKLLGERDFAELADEYVKAHDSRFFSIRNYGHALPHFVSMDTHYRPVPLLTDLARWEWTLAEVFDAADEQPVDMGALANKSPGDWAFMRLTFHPSVRVLGLTWNAPQIWKALTGDTDRPRASVEREPVPWLLWRHELKELFRPLSVAEDRALAAARAGDSFGEVCALTCEHFREDEAPAQAAAFLRSWVESGLITGLS